jgi:hypothetical protein
VSERIEALSQTTGDTPPTRPWLPGQVPLLIGVTGHLEIRASDLDALREQIRQALRRLIKDHPHTPFAVMSSLAEGGDRIVADIALEKEFNARLIVPLPMRRELYEEDFRNSANSENPGDRPSLTPNNPSSNTSLKEFRRFLDHPNTTWFELESHLVRGEVAPVTAEAIRKRRYAAAGAFIVRNCQILFALWDGVENADEGGTADTKNFKLHGVPRGYLPAEYSGETWDVGPVFHFHAPRKNSTLPATKDVPMVPLYPRSFEYHNREEAAEFYSERVFKPLEDFNAGVSAIERGESDVDLNRPLKFIPAKQIKGSVSESEASALNAIESVAAKADGLSLHFQPRTNGTAIALSIFVLLGAISLEYSTHFLNGEHDHLAKFVFLLLYPASMVVAFAFYRVARSGRFQDQYQDYRALAEGLRVQYFWHAAGVSVPVAENYLPSHRFELNWINNACRAVELLHKSSGAALDRPRTDLVIEHWIRDQLRYYEASWKKNHRRLLGWEITGSGSLLLGLVVVVAVAVAGIGHAQDMFHGDLHKIAAKLADHNDPAHMWAMMFAVISAVVAALSHSWIQRAAYEEHIKQYARMIRIFKDHLKEIRSLLELGDYRSIKTELLALGREALMENSAWVLTHRERPLEIPHH